eukprot:3549350-Amphidinium_carterae.1
MTVMSSPVCPEVRMGWRSREVHLQASPNFTKCQRTWVEMRIVCFVKLCFVLGKKTAQLKSMTKEVVPRGINVSIMLLKSPKTTDLSLYNPKPAKRYCSP